VGEEKNSDLAFRHGPTIASVLHRFQIDFADFKFRAFTLQADEAGRHVAAGDFVHGLAIDDDLDRVAAAGCLVSVPFADRIFGGGLEHFNSILLQIERLAARHAAPQPEIALVVMHPLALDTAWPDSVRQLHVHEHAGVAGLEETPLDGANVIAVNLFRAHETIRLAGAMNEAVGDVPGFFGRGIGTHAKSPAIKIRPVEEVGALRERLN